MPAGLATNWCLWLEKKGLFSHICCLSVLHQTKCKLLSSSQPVRADLGFSARRSAIFQFIESISVFIACDLNVLVHPRFNLQQPVKHSAAQSGPGKWSSEDRTSVHHHRSFTSHITPRGRELHTARSRAPRRTRQSADTRGEVVCAAKNNPSVIYTPNNV